MNKSFKENTRDMTLKQKIEYIWEYYKFFILGSIFLIIIISSILNETVFNPPAKTYVGVSIVGSESVGSENLDALKVFLTAKILPNSTENVEIRVDNYFESADPNHNMAMQQKLVANITIKEIDVIIMDLDRTDEETREDLFDDLSKYFSMEELKNFSKDFLYSKDKKIIGIYTSNSDVLKKFGVTNQNQVIAIATSTIRSDRAKEAFKILIK